MKRIAFTAPVDLSRLAPELQLVRSAQVHSCSWIHMLAEALLREQELDLHLVTTTPLVARSTTIRKDGLTYHVLKTSLPGIHRSLSLSTAYGLFAWPVATMIRRLRSIRPDLVHGHGCEGPYALAAIHSGFPYTISLQGIMTEIAKVEPSLHNRIAARTERFAVRRAGYVNIKSNFSRSFVDRLDGFRGKTFFIEPAINPLFWQAQVPLPRPRILFVGAVIERKGVADLLDACGILRGAHPELRLTVIGEGLSSDIAKYRLRAEGLGLGAAVEFAGRLRADQIQARFAEGGVFCLPSHIENSPNSIMEAMAAGLPVVASDVGDVRNIVADRESGCLVPAHRPDKLAAAISTILGDREFHASAGAAGRSIADRRWRASAVARKHLEMYREAIGGSS